MQLRKGKTKSLLDSSIDCALLAVEIYNKPRAPFRVESFITHMIMAWTRLFQAYFNNTIGEKFFYKEKNGRYKIIDGEKKAWELKTCICKYGQLNDAVRSNLDFFIRLRNKIEHRTIEKDEIGLMIFGECQSLLYNYENELIKLFGSEYSINESLAYSLQFSRIRTKGQLEANRQILSNEVKELRSFIEKYRIALNSEIFNAQEYSIKLIQLPKIANTSRNDLAVEFVNWSSLSEEDKKNYELITTIIKDKVIKKEVINPGKLKPGQILEKVNSQIEEKLNNYDHKCISAILGIRPYKDFNKKYDPFDTNVNFCHYDEVHKDYLYQNVWADFLIRNIKLGRLNKNLWREKFKNNEVLDIIEYNMP